MNECQGTERIGKIVSVVKEIQNEDNRNEHKKERHNRVISVRQRWRRYMVNVVHGQYWFLGHVVYMAG